MHIGESPTDVIFSNMIPAYTIVCHFKWKLGNLHYLSTFEVLPLTQMLHTNAVSTLNIWIMRGHNFSMFLEFYYSESKVKLWLTQIQIQSPCLLVFLLLNLKLFLMTGFEFSTPKLQFTPIHRGVFCQFGFRWIYYYGSNKSTGKETGKMHLCAVPTILV